MSQPQLKVIYFPMAGRAEITRLVLAFGGIAFEDSRIQNFAEIKSTLPLGQLPAIEVDGVVYAQSMAMARYAGRLTGLYPADALEALKVDMLLETLVDALNTFVEINWKTPDEAVKAEKTKNFIEQGLPKVFGLLEKNATGKFFLGDKASLADVYVFDLFNNAIKTNFSDFKVASFPKVEAIIANVAANPGVVAYLAKHQ